MLIKKIAREWWRIEYEEAVGYVPEWEPRPEAIRTKCRSFDDFLKTIDTLLGDPGGAEITAGTTATALVEELGRKIGSTPTRRQVEELALAHLAVAAELVQVADGWENEDDAGDVREGEEEPAAATTTSTGDRETPVIPEDVQRGLLAAWQSP